MPPFQLPASKHATFPHLRVGRGPGWGPVGKSPSTTAARAGKDPINVDGASPRRSAYGGRELPEGRQVSWATGQGETHSCPRARGSPENVEGAESWETGSSGRRRGTLFPFTLLPHPQAKIVLLFPLDKRQQLAEVAAGPGARPGRPGEDATGAPVGSPEAAPMLRGAGDCADRREGARAREMKKILVLLLLLDARLQEAGRCAAGAPGPGAKSAQGWPRLYSRLLTVVEADREADPAEEQRRKRGRCPRPRS